MKREKYFNGVTTSDDVFNFKRGEGTRAVKMSSKLEIRPKKLFFNTDLLGEQGFLVGFDLLILLPVSNSKQSD